MHNRALGAGSQGVFDNLSFISQGFSGPSSLLERRSPNSFADRTISLRTRWFSTNFHPEVSTSEAVPFYVASIPLPGVHGNIAYGVGARFAAADEAGLYRIALPTTWAPGFGIQPRDQFPLHQQRRDIGCVCWAIPPPSPISGINNVPLNDGPTGWGSTLSGNARSVLGLTECDLKSIEPQPSITSTDASRPTLRQHIGFSAYIVVSAPDYNCDRVVDFFDLPGFRGGLLLQLALAPTSMPMM